MLDGDVIISIGDAVVRGMSRLVKYLAEYTVPGDEVVLRVVRAAELGGRPRDRRSGRPDSRAATSGILDQATGP